uniref:Secreted protein n=1 Tax=Heterorhabditis bacteriophora TaxID=37862 RepID=A0A1I7WIP8_HETBA
MYLYNQFRSHLMFIGPHLNPTLEAQVLAEFIPIGLFRLTNAGHKRCSSWDTINFVAILLRCDCFTRIQEVVVDNYTCRPPNNGHNLLLVQLRFGEVFCGFILVQALHGTSPVIVYDPFFIFKFPHLGKYRATVQ